jgi:shikimate kinase
MKLKKNLVLLGMMGSGKSTIGRLVSKKLSQKLVDIDDIIEEETNMKINEIFLKKGEIFFRNLEEKITLKFLDNYNIIISLGGGAFINDRIRKEVLKNNLSFWLNWNAYTLLDRIKKNKKRPLASNLNETKLMELITNRSKIYSKAKFKINCQKLSKKEITKKIISLYEKNYD